ncbi:MAG: hypothetical protein MK411_11050 [SAR202 cluster bacterium]|nr:hypothetical protein [SAR202 cluster bacterium]
MLPLYSKDLKNTSSTSPTSPVGNSLGEEDRNSLTSSTSSVDDPSQLHLPVNRKKYPDDEGQRRALMDKIPTDELVEIVKRRGLNGNVHKTE